MPPAKTTSRLVDWPEEETVFDPGGRCPSIDGDLHVGGTRDRPVPVTLAPQIGVDLYMPARQKLIPKSTGRFGN